MSVPTFAKGIRFRRNADGNGILLIPEGVVNLNTPAAAIAELIDGQRTVVAIAADLCSRFGVSHAEMVRDVEELLHHFAARTWVVFAEAGQRDTTATPQR
jgi:pyrroloquinoline quinone biosynthesis protein D